MNDSYWDNVVRQDQKSRGLTNLLDGYNPTAARRAARLGVSLGIDEGTVKADVEGFEKQEEHESAKTILDYAPGLATFISDPINATKAKDDLPPLGEISKMLGMQTPANQQDMYGYGAIDRFKKTLMTTTKTPAILARRQESLSQGTRLARGTYTAGIYRTAATGLGDVVTAGADFAASVLGLDDNLNGWSQWQEWKDSQARNKYLAQQDFSKWEYNLPLIGQTDLNPAKFAYSGLQSIAQMLVGAGISQKLLLPILSVESGSAQYVTSRDRGAGAGEALLGGAIVGGIEAVTERSPLEFLLNKFGTDGAGAFVKGWLVREVPGEVAATIGQGAVDAAGTGGEGMESWAQHLPQDIVDTIGSTLLMGGMLGGPSGLIARRARASEKRITDTAEALAGGQWVDQMMAAAEQSKLRTEDVDTFKTFVERHAEQTPIRNVYLDGEAVRTLMQSEGYDGSLDRFAPQIAEAQATQGDVAIPLADAVAHLAGTTAWEALKEDSYLIPGGITRRLAQQNNEQMLEELEKAGAKLAKDAEKAGVDAAELNEVKGDIRNALLAANLPAKQIPAYVEIMAARAGVIAAQRGITPMEAWQQQKISILGKGEQGEVAGRAMAQSDPLIIGGLSYAIDEEGKYRVSLQAEDRNDELGSALSIGDLRETIGDELTARVLAGEGQQGEEGQRTIGNLDLTDKEGKLDLRQLPPRQLFQGPLTEQDLMDRVPGYGQIAPYLDDEEKANLREKSVQKIVDLVETFPDAEEMASVAFAGRAKKGWYERSAQAILDVFGLEDATRFAALLAATSPQTSVESNTINALNIWMNWDAAGRPTDLRAITAIMGQSVQGGKGEGSILPAWINNTYRALSSDNPADIKLSGPKVNSFMLNLIGIVDEVTNDAWMANWALLEASVFRGTPRTTEAGDKLMDKGLGYRAFNALVRKAADILSQRTGDTWTPSNIQEAVWSFTKVVTEARQAAGSKTVDELLQYGGITHADIGETPDFALLFQRGVYRRILEEGGYGEAAAQLEIDRGEVAGSPRAEGSVAAPEGAGIDAATFLEHLGATGARIEERVGREREEQRQGQLDLFANYDTTPLEGLPSPIRVDGVPVKFGAHGPIREAARRYMLRTGLPYSPPQDYVPVNEERAVRIAEAFEAMEHNPEDPEVKRAYRAMIDETVAQYRQLLKDTGLVVEFIEGEDPYGNPRNAIIDVVENNHLWVFPTDAGFGGPASAEVDVAGNPLLEIVPGIKISGRPVRANDLFRVVHDVFGHIKEGVGFRADGEENAWRMHSAMYSPLARRAMTTETRGQNSWVNYGPFGEQNRTASGADTEYAPQKIGLLPLWVSEEGSGQPRTLYQDALPEAGWTPERLSGLIDTYARADGQTSALMAMMTPDEYLGALASEEGRNVIEEKVRDLPQYGPLDIDKLRAAGAPVVTIALTPGGDRSGPMIRGHNGRHRAAMLKAAGVGRFPVVVQLMDKDGKTIFTAEPMDIENILPNRSRLDPLANGDTPLNINQGTPINWKYHDQLRAAGNGGRVLFQSQEQVFYSALERAVAESKQAKATGAQWLATLRKTPGIKQEELEWSGLEELLQNSEGSISKDQLAEVLSLGGIQLDEVMLGRPHAEILADYGYTEDDLEDEEHEGHVILGDSAVMTQYDSWSSDPKSPTYRELLLTLPLGVRGNPKRAARTHWEAEGVIAHTRFMDKTDAEGKRVLFIEEVQSDWHQKGRDQGYTEKADPKKIEEAKAKVTAADEATQKAYERNVKLGQEIRPLIFPLAERAYREQIDPAIATLREQAKEKLEGKDDLQKLMIAEDFATREQSVRDIFHRDIIGMLGSPTETNIIGWAELDKQLQKIRQIASIRGWEAEIPDKLLSLMAQFDNSEIDLKDKTETLRLRNRELQMIESGAGIPNAPFKTSWPALVMKRIIRYAAENGYDRVAWTTGKEQAERYNLSEAVGSLVLEGMQDSEGYRIRMKGSAASALAEHGHGEIVEGGYGDQTLRMTEGQMREAFGNDITQRLLESDGAPVSGEGLQVGGEGMKAFYDRNLINITNDIIKKMGGKVVPVNILTGSQSERDRLARLATFERQEGDDLVRAGDESMAAIAYERANQADTSRKQSKVNPGFDITDEVRRKVLFGQPLFQQERGQINLMDNGEKIIQLFANSDPSTLIHELGHAWLEELRADALRAEKGSQLAEDWNRVKSWWADQGIVVNDRDPIPTAAHEVWARGMERFVMEGRAPSTALGKAFGQFRAWLMRLYQVVENLNTPITPEIREVFGRLLATQDQIDQQAEIQNAAPLFKSAEDAGMSEAEFEDYMLRVGEARDEAYNTLLFKTMEAIRKRVTAERRRQRASIRDDVATSVGQQPQFIALHLLRTGRWLGDPERPAERVKLNAGWLLDNFGDDILDKLPRGLPIVAGDGQHGDEVAEMVGMSSGQELVHALVGMRSASDAMRANGEKRSLRDVIVDEEVDRRMAAEHGDTLNDGSIEEEAIAALNTAAQGDIISAEIRQLTKRTTIPGRVTPYQMVRDWAKRKVTAGKVADVASRGAMQRYTRAAAKAAKLAEEAILSGNVDEAYKQKQAQLINHALLAEAKLAADRVDTIVNKMRRLSKRAAMKSVDPDYMAKVHMLLENYDFRPRSQKSIDEQVGFEKWLLDQRSKGYEVHVPPRLENNGTPFSRVSVEELESMNDLVDSLLALGRTKQKLKTAQGERDFAEWRDEALAAMEQLPDRDFSEPVGKLGLKKQKNAKSPINEPERKLAAASSELLKVETIAEELDGGKTGPFNDLLTVGAGAAENLRVRLREKVMKPLTKMYLSMGRGMWNRMQEKVTIPELTWNTLNEGDPRTGTPVTLTRMELLSIALNTGNLSNFEKMSKGERWPAQTIQAVLDRELTKEDWDFVQSLWTQVEQLWPDIVAAEREMSGIIPEKVVNNPIETRYGTYEGGYWPVVYDAARWQRAEDLEGQKLDDMFGLKSGVATQKGHTIERTAAFGPISYDLENILFNHIEQVVTRIAYAPFARDVLRAIRDKQVRGMIDTKLGPEYRKQIEPWLQRQINEGASMSQGARWWNRLLRQFRINMTIAAMGFRVSTGVAQTLGLTASAQRIGARWVGTGLKTLTLNPRKATQFVWDRSEEMLHRTENFSREMNELSQKMRSKHNWVTNAQYWAMWHIGMIDRYCVSVPTWLGAHAKGMSQGMTDEEASRYADKEVRQSQGSGREKDLAKVQSMANGEAFRFFTMFYTPFNVMFNAQWQGLRGLRKGDIRPAISVTFWWMIASTLGDALMNWDLPGDDDDDGIGDDIAAWFARNVFFGMWAGIPLVRDVANGVERTINGQYTDPGSNPVSRVYDAVDRSWQIGDKFAEEGELPEKPIKTFGNLAAVFTGLPLSQPGTTGQFLWDYSEGNTDPQNVSDWYFGITKDKVPSEEEE